MSWNTEDDDLMREINFSLSSLGRCKWKNGSAVLFAMTKSFQAVLERDMLSSPSQPLSFQAWPEARKETELHPVLNSQ